MRFIPAAITPVSFGDIWSGIISKHGIDSFEELIASFFNASKAYSFTSLMRANYALFSHLSEQDKRGEIVLPRYCCPSFIHGVLAANLKIRFCDLDPNTLSYSLEDLRKIDSSDVLAIVCVNFFGLTNQVDEVKKWAEEKNIFVIESVDYGIGTEYKGKRIGTYGDYTILNFQEGKAIPIGGGMIVENQHCPLKPLSKSLRKRASNILLMCAFSLFSRPGYYYLFRKAISLSKLKAKLFSMEDTIRRTNDETDFTFRDNITLCRLSDFQGALGMCLFKKMPQHIILRQENSKKIIEQIANIKNVQLIKPEEGSSNIHYIRLPILVLRGLRDPLLKALLEANIEASPMYIEHGTKIDCQEFPGSLRVLNELLTLPCHPYVNDKDINKMTSIIKTICD